MADLSDNNTLDNCRKKSHRRKNNKKKQLQHTAGKIKPLSISLCVCCVVSVID